LRPFIASYVRVLFDDNAVVAANGD
jgi:hypothetical protein